MTLLSITSELMPHFKAFVFKTGWIELAELLLLISLKEQLPLEEKVRDSNPLGHVTLPLLD